MYSTSLLHVNDDEGQKRDRMEVMPKSECIFLKEANHGELVMVLKHFPHCRCMLRDKILDLSGKQAEEKYELRLTYRSSPPEALHVDGLRSL